MAATESSFAWVAAPDRKRLPKVTACYAIYLGHELLYVGSAVNLRRRFYLHQIDDNFICYRSFVGDPSKIRVEYITCSRQELVGLEKHLIKTLNPPMNKRCG
jgi:excinuclease UvrABC nuclease subunit